jgi:L-2-hydroxycarboxylate dehydrogenase (NAD+)
MHEPILVGAEELRRFVARAFATVGLSPADADIAADVLVTADLRGVDSHGVARLHNYLKRLYKGLIATTSAPTIVRERPAALTLDAGNGVGLVAAYRAMELTIERAAKYGSAAVAVQHSNHFGIAGYFAMMALRHDMIGLAMCNASPTVVPFGGRQSMLGTNPIAWAIPCGEEPALVADMATSNVAFGKLEIAGRTEQPIPVGWALNAEGGPTTDPIEAMQVYKMLPLGGMAEGTGYKGYALATVVEALSHALSGAAMSLDVIGAASSRVILNPEAHGEQPSNIGHFFAAYSVDAFRPVDEFKRDMDELVRTLRSCPPQEGVASVLIPGEREHRTAIHRAQGGIPLHPRVIEALRIVAEEYNLDPVA